MKNAKEARNGKRGRLWGVNSEVGRVEKGGISGVFCATGDVSKKPGGNVKGEFNAYLSNGSLHIHAEASTGPSNEKVPHRPAIELLLWGENP